MQAVENGDQLVDIFLRAPKRVSLECVSRGLLPAVKVGHLAVILQLIRAGADANYDEGSAFRCAIEIGRADIAAALLMSSKCPPSGVLVDRAIEQTLKQPAPMVNDSVPVLELLLCGNPIGNAKHEGLIKAAMFFNLNLARIFLAYGADINFNNATALSHAIQTNRGDIVTLLLQKQVLNPELASVLVSRIPERCPSADRIGILSKLIVSGASGHYCSQLLIKATEEDDLDTARLLVSSKDQRGVLISSVDFNASRCMVIAVTREKIELLKILALEGVPSQFSLRKALTSIPITTNPDIRFSMVQILLQGGVQGPEVDAMLHATVNASQKSTKLIKVLVDHGARITDETLFTAISQGLLDVVKILLNAKLTQTFLSAIPLAMELQTPKTRFEIIKALLDTIGPAVIESTPITQAVIDTLYKFPEDIPLLRVLCQDGRANINLLDGRAAVLATNVRSPAILDIVLRSRGGLPNQSTIGIALKSATRLPVNDPSRAHKVERLLQGVKPQQIIDEILLTEVQSTVAQKYNVSVLQSLLSAGANVNSNEGAPLVAAVSDPSITDIILSRKPDSRSLSVGFAQAMKMKGPARYNICEKLIRAGARGEEINKALCVAANERDLTFIQLLLPEADVNFKGGRALRRAVEQAFLEGLDILLTSRPILPSPATKANAFYEAMKLIHRGNRNAVVNRLLIAKIPIEALSEGLISAVNASDLELIDSLLRFGGSLEHSVGQAVLCAASLGRADVLKLLVQGKYGRKPTLSTLVSGFVGATTIMEKDQGSHYTIVETLLQAGARGDAISIALIEAVKQGDRNLRLTELLCRNGASVEWEDGTALEIAARSAEMKTIATLLSRQPTQGVLRRAFVSATDLPRDQRHQVIKALLNAGKGIDKHVSKMFTRVAKESPPDRELLELFLSYEFYDNGEAIMHVATGQDLTTLTLLIEPANAKPHVSSTFKAIMSIDDFWKTYRGFSIVETLLKNGVTGEPVNEALRLAVEKSCMKSTDLLRDFVDLLLQFNSDVNYDRGAVLQQATSNLNVSAVRKLLPYASTNTKAIALPYVFSTTQDINAVMQIIQAFADSLPDVERDCFSDFEHPDSQLNPVLFHALSEYPRKADMLKVLLDMGYSPNQWRLQDTGQGAGPEAWSILCWALDQAEKKVSDTIVEMLIDRGGESTVGGSVWR
jgi:ankyrin repeat protein